MFHFACQAGLTANGTGYQRERRAALNGLEEFRREVRAWLEESCPPSMRTPCVRQDEEVWGGRRGTFPSEEARLWHERMARRGGAAPAGPGGGGGAGRS